MSAELLPCPFCGGAMKYYTETRDGKVSQWWSHPAWGDYPKQDKYKLTQCPVYAWRAFTDERERLDGWNCRVPVSKSQSRKPIGAS